MINPGDIVPRCDSDSDLYVAVLSNTLHLVAATGRVIVCPFIPGALPDGAMAMVIAVEHPEGVLLPELVQWLPVVALAEPIGAVSPPALRAAADMVTALIS